jgi:hypothetical protein
MDRRAVSSQHYTVSSNKESYIDIFYYVYTYPSQIGTEIKSDTLCGQSQISKRSTDKWWRSEINGSAITAKQTNPHFDSEQDIRPRNALANQLAALARSSTALGHRSSLTRRILALPSRTKANIACQRVCQPSAELHGCYH